MKTKNLLKNEHVCSRHFVSGRPAANWDRFNEDWVSTTHLTKKEYKKKDVEAAREQSPKEECDRATRTRGSQEEKISQ